MTFELFEKHIPMKKQIFLVAMVAVRMVFSLFLYSARTTNG